MGTTLRPIPILIIILAVTSRLIPHPDNFAPITAIALFGGVYLSKKYAFILPIAAMLISDYFLGFDWSSFGYVYTSFILSGLVGVWIRRRNFGYKIYGTLLASVIFYLITNFGVWAAPNSWYSRDLIGLLNSYIAGIPFFRNTLLGDLFYSGVLFGSYIIIQTFKEKVNFKLKQEFN